MPPRRSRCCLAVEALEDRWALSALPVNTIGIAHGFVSVPHSVAPAPVLITPRNLTPRRATTLFTLSVTPDSGSALNPAVVFAQGPTGAKLALRRGAPFIPVQHPESIAFTRDGQPGPLTSGITGHRATTGAFTEATSLPGDVNGDGRVDLGDLQAFASAFGTTRNDPLYKPSADANHNGFVGIGDAKFLERNLTPLTPKIPIKIDLHLAPGEQVLHAKEHNSGGETRVADITILGRTTPGAIVFTDSAAANYKFDGKALPTDAQGDFSFKTHLKDRLTNFEFLAIDPFGQQTIRAFPVRFLLP